MTQLSSLELIRPLASGGSAHVWLARHRHTTHPVAVKFLRSDRAWLASMIASEAASLARLDHRYIATIYDLATLTQPLTLPQSHGQLAAHTPYLVMELATQGSLVSRGPSLSEAERVTVLAQTLEALAHIHAHQLLHLDIKPSNVLLTAHELAANAEVRVVDMGLGSISSLDEVGSVGTPGYMAPEQADRGLGALGPWTDLYGVGLLAAELWLGQPLHSSPEDALLSLPAPLKRWIDRMLANAPEQRYSSAPAARYALLKALGEGAPISLERGADAALAGLLSPSETTVYSTMVHLEPMSLPGGDGAHEVTALSAPGDVVFEGGDALEWPVSWGLPHQPKPLYRLAELGSGVFALRAFRLIGRVAERDALWAALTTGQRSLALSGEPGVGLSALAAWLGVRAAELVDARCLRPSELDAERPIEVYARLARRLVGMLAVADPQRVALAQALDRFTRGLPGLQNIVDEELLLERCAQALAALSLRQPVVLIVDDAGRKPALCKLALRLEESDAARGHLLCLLVRPEQAWPHQLHVGPMPQRELAALINQALGVDPVIIDELAHRAQGQPRFVTDTIQRWLQRDQLEPGPKGLTLDSWREPWLGDAPKDQLSRLGALLEGGDEDALRAIALLALLTKHSQAIEREVYERALGLAGLAWPAQLIEALSAASLLAQDRRVLAFVSAPLVDASWERLAPMITSSLCEVAFEALSSVRQLKLAPGRLWAAQLWAACGAQARCMREIAALLMAGVDGQNAARGLALAESLGELFGAQLEAQHRLVLSLLKARCLYVLGDHSADVVLDGLSPSLQGAEQSVRYAYKEMRLLAALSRGELRTATAVAQELEALLQEQDTPAEIIARGGMALARYGIHANLYAEAISQAQRALRFVEGLDESELKLAILNSLSIALLESAQLESARQHLEETIRLADSLGSTKFEVMALNSLGDVEMRLGRWDEAKHCFERGLALWQNRYPLATYLRGNLAWVALNQGDARGALEHLQDAISRQRQEMNISRLYLMELRQYALALLGVEEGWDRCMDELDALLDHVDVAHEEGAAAASRTHQLWLERGQAARAARALAMHERLSARLS